MTMHDDTAIGLGQALLSAPVFAPRTLIPLSDQSTQTTSPFCIHTIAQLRRLKKVVGLLVCRWVEMGREARTYLLCCQTWAKVKIILEASGGFLAEAVLFEMHDCGEKGGGAKSGVRDMGGRYAQEGGCNGRNGKRDKILLYTLSHHSVNWRLVLKGALEVVATRIGS